MHFLHHLTSNLNPTQGHACPMANSPAPERRQDEARAVSPPGLKALLVACVFPPVPKSEDLVVIRRHLSGVGLGCAAQIQALDL